LKIRIRSIDQRFDLLIHRILPSSGINTGIRRF
jgi:hypothetical protein